ncbi:1-phosphatidylinositol 4,5-bisphosphate phosphodiesterase classes I and II isoform X2 [Vanessa cardui]|uniref:1-phosphatidylinositol 4,5-bisphosphate phosphodiesterase classes I and II isoform X2 n=1 Tax=Vanessa cardui TaxID=171605 RepID=UPI001F145120|nr:1-phosphatidylinositol 4,5-bisphosphate phosphodiesterase classes I and II isoform X2 [Vanessa cardui]
MTTTTKSAKVSLKPIEVPKALQEGEKFIKWDEDSGTGLPVTLRVDPKGFFLYWTDQNMEVEMLDIATIRDVRTGVYAKLPKDQKTRNVVLIGSQGSLEEKTVTVCYGADFVNITFVNFCCTRKEIAKMWTEELFTLAYNLNQYNNPTIKFLEKLHTKIVLKADKSGKILVKNIVRLFAQNKEDKKRVEKALSESGLPTGKNDTISQSKFQFEDFFAFYKSLTQRTEVQKIFNNLTDGKPYLSANQLVDFLNDVQRDPRLNEILHPYADIQRARDLIKAYEHNKYHQQRSQLTFDGFLRFLMSEDNPIVAPNKLDLCDDMDQPLAHYFINSSHNTYLTGHQITGKSSVEIYRQGLLAGCRCVELDFWNGRTEEPVIVHGYTFVPEISAKEVLEAIAESAFKTSDYPVILSFENHCNPRQQAKIANYCRDIFGDMLLDKALDSHPLEPGGELPPPAMLKNKIIIKNKKKHHHHHKKEEPVVEEGEKSEAAPQGNGEVAHGPLVRQGSKESSSSSESESSSEEEGGGEAGGAAEEARETHAAAEISALVNYVQPVHFSSFENAESERHPYYHLTLTHTISICTSPPLRTPRVSATHTIISHSHIRSRFAHLLLRERREKEPILRDVIVRREASDNASQGAADRVRELQQAPAVARVPRRDALRLLKLHAAGCQLVALNYQTLDLAMQLNLGTFEYNRRCGYLLKPEFMRRKDRRLDPFAESTVDGIIAGSLSVSVVSGQLLTDKRTGTYVEVDMFGLPADTVRKKFRTKVVPNNGINPVYGDEPFVFKKVVLPELAMLRIAAHEDSGRLLGHRVLPVLGLCPGYRHVGLRAELGLPLPASLLLHVRVKDYVPDRLSELAEALANPIKYQSDMEKRSHQLAVLTDDTDEPARAEPVRRPLSHLGAATRPDCSMDGSPNKVNTSTEKIPNETENSQQPADPEKDTPGEKDEAETKWNGSGTTEEDFTEALDALLNSKVVREKRAELARKLDALRRKSARTKPVSAKFFVKRLSTRNMSEPAAADDADAGAAERELRLRYHHAIYAALEKNLRNEQQQQMKALTDLLEAEKKEILNKLANSRKEDVKALSKKTNRDKDEILRIKREIHSQSVERGVAECSRLEHAHARRREQLARAHERRHHALLLRRDQELLELERLCGGAPDG